MNEIPSLSELKNLASKSGLSVFEGLISGELPKVDLFLNKEHPIEEFMELVQVLGKKYFFVDYAKPHAETDEELIDSYGIDLSEITKEFYGDYYKEIYKKAKEFNNKLLKFPRDEAYDADLYVIDSGVTYVLSLSAEEEPGFGCADEYFNEICEEFHVNRRERVAKKREEADKKREELFDKMVGDLINDGVFLKCNTKESRKLFLYNYLRKNNLDEAFDSHYKSNKALEAFADLLYATVRSKK
jgi:hypothetical protein